jgi:acyl CoA:acetate/3-ketoacid CoA transferase
MESWLKADFSIIKAWKGDASGNLIFRGTARNFNEMMASAGKICIAEVEELVPIGSLDPNQIHVSGVYVHRIFEGKIIKNALNSELLKHQTTQLKSLKISYKDKDFQKIKLLNVSPKS